MTLLMPFYAFREGQDRKQNNHIINVEWKYETGHEEKSHSEQNVASN